MIPKKEWVSRCMSDEIDSHLYSVLLKIICSLVDEPTDVVIHCSSQLDASSFEVACNPADVGKLIGKRGRTAQSIRTILSGMAMKHHRRCRVDIITRGEGAVAIE
jgi:predicted RNA-binding protein YlqC (UPF0109 family)